MNALDSIFFTRLGGTGVIDEPGVRLSAEVPKWVVGQGALLWLGRTWLRSRPEEGGVYRIDLRCYNNLSRYIV